MQTLVLQLLRHKFQEQCQKLPELPSTTRITGFDFPDLNQHGKESYGEPEQK
jgi:hypothetical protein